MTGKLTRIYWKPRYIRKAMCAECVSTGNPEGSMSKSCAGFLEEWESYLRLQNHMTAQEEAGQYWHLLRSTDERGLSYLWIITCYQENVKRFSKSEIRILNGFKKTLSKHNTKIFLVVKLYLPVPKVVIAGIDFILKKKTVSSSKGGIDWSSWNHSS